MQHSSFGFRENLINLLGEYHPKTFEEIEFKAQILDFVMTYEKCFDRSLDIGHMTASAWLLDKTGSKALMMHHAKLDQWVQLGGHCDGDPDVLEVSIKEAKEESGIQQIFPVDDKIFDIDIHLIPETQKEKAHLHYDIRFLLQVTSDEEFKKNHESKSLRWVEKDKEKLPTRSRSILRMFDKWVAIKG